jgi:hypothetical protein
MGFYVKVLRHIKNDDLINKFKMIALFHAFEMYYDSTEFMCGGFDDDFYTYDEIVAGKTYRGEKRAQIAKIYISSDTFKAILPYIKRYYLAP